MCNNFLKVALKSKVKQYWFQFFFKYSWSFLFIYVTDECMTECSRSYNKTSYWFIVVLISYHMFGTQLFKRVSNRSILSTGIFSLPQVKWLIYCRQGDKQQRINQSINQSLRTPALPKVQKGAGDVSLAWWFYWLLYNQKD